MKKIFLTTMMAVLAAVGFAQDEVTFQWSVPIQSSNAVNVRDIQTDGTFIYCVGDYKGTVEFNPNGVSSQLTSTSTYSQGFLAKYDQNGILIWSTETSWVYKSNFNSYDFKLSINPVSGKMVVSKAAIGGGTYRYVALVFDATGSLLWENNFIVGAYTQWDFKGACIDDQDAIYAFGTVPGGATGLSYTEFSATGSIVTGYSNPLSGTVEHNVIYKIGSCSGLF